MDRDTFSGNRYPRTGSIDNGSHTLTSEQEKSKHEQLANSTQSTRKFTCSCGSLVDNTPAAIANHGRTREHKNAGKMKPLPTLRKNTRQSSVVPQPPQPLKPQWLTPSTSERPSSAAPGHSPAVPQPPQPPIPQWETAPTDRQDPRLSTTAPPPSDQKESERQSQTSSDDTSKAVTSDRPSQRSRGLTIKDLLN